MKRNSLHSESTQLEIRSAQIFYRRTIIMRSYETARSLFSFLAFCAWSVVIIGVLVAVTGAGSVSQYGGTGAGLIAMVPGIGIGLLGLLLVAFVQMGRATVDTAEYTQQILKISRDQLEVSTQGLKLQAAVPHTFATAAQTESAQEAKSSFASQADNYSPQGRTVGTIAPEEPIDQNAVYRGKTIREQKGKFIYKGIEFDTLLAAKDHIDSLAVPLARKLPGAIRKT
jgi:hypothetical protein